MEQRPSCLKINLTVEQQKDVLEYKNVTFCFYNAVKSQFKGIV